MHANIDRTWSRKDTAAVVWVFLAALVIRLVFVLTVHPVPVSDFDWYYGRALEIVHGLGFSRGDHPTAYFPPGWPYFLAGLIRVFGASPVIGEVAQAVLGALTAAIVVVIGRHVAGRSAAIAAGAAYAALPSAVEWTSTLASEPLYTFLWALATAIWVSVSTRQLGWYALSGVILGVAALVRPSALLFWIILLVYLLTLRSERIHWRRLVAAVAVTAFCTLIVVVPWIVRDYDVFHTVVAISNNGGLSLYQANNPHSNAAYTELDNPKIAALVRNPSTEAVGDQLASQLAMRYMQTHIPHEFVLSLLKVKALYTRDDSVLSYSFAKTVPPASHRTIALVFALNTAAYFALMFFALLGVVWCFLNRRGETQPQWRLVFGMMVYNTMIFSLIGGIDRYRFPTMPYFSVFAGIGIAVAFSYIFARAGTTESSTSANRFAQDSPQ